MKEKSIKPGPFKEKPMLIGQIRRLLEKVRKGVSLYSTNEQSPKTD